MHRVPGNSGTSEVTDTRLDLLSQKPYKPESLTGRQVYDLEDRAALGQFILDHFECQNIRAQIIITCPAAVGADLESPDEVFLDHVRVLRHHVGMYGGYKGLVMSRG